MPTDCQVPVSFKNLVPQTEQILDMQESDLLPYGSYPRLTRTQDQLQHSRFKQSNLRYGQFLHEI